MKVALLIAGYLRCFENNVESLKKHLLDIYDVDVYIHITDCEESKYLNKPIDINKITEWLNPKMIIISKNFEFNNKFNNLYNQNYKFYMLNKKRIEIEKVENIKYDVVIKFRPDINLQQNFDFKNIENVIYIPKDDKLDISKLKNHDDKFLCDIIAYGPYDLMNSYFELYLNLDNLITHHGDVNENLLYNHLNSSNIKYKLIDFKYFVMLSLINTIAIAGDSGVGKTRLSNMIKNIFNESFVLECDRYHKWERGNENWNNITHLNPEANFITKMNDDVFDLKIGNNIYQVDYDHNTGKFTDKMCIESKENIIICGLHTLYMNKNIIDIKIFIDAEDSVKIPWKIKRDVSKRGYTIEKIMNQIESRKEDYINYIYPQKDNADIIISYYNDNLFDINNFKIDNDIDFKFKIGINNKYDLKNIMKGLEITKILNDDKFYFLYFDNADFDIVIKNIIISFFCL